MKKKIVLAAVLVLALIVGVSAIAGAANKTAFVPSIEQKSVAEVETGTVTVNGVEIDVENLEANGLKLDVTPIADADEVPASMQEEFKAAYDELKEAEGIDALNFTSEGKTLAEALEEAGKPEDTSLAVTDVINIALTDKSGEVVDCDKISVEIKLDYVDSVCAVIHYTASGWEVVDFTVTEESIVLTDIEPGVYAFVVDAVAYSEGRVNLFD